MLMKNIKTFAEIFISDSYWYCQCKQIMFRSSDLTSKCELSIFCDRFSEIYWEEKT